MLALIGFDESGERVEFVAFGRALRRIPQGLDAAERLFVVRFSANRFNRHISRF